MTPEEKAARASEWRYQNGDEWDFMVYEAKRESRDRGWASIHNAADRTRMERNIRIPNVIKPALSRLMVLENPELDKYLVRNQADVDTVDLEGIYRKIGEKYGEA